MTASSPSVGSGLGQPSAVAILFFLLFILVTLGITWWAARRSRSADEYFAAGHSITAGQNGVALAGDFVAAAGFLGISGVVALSGFDGIIYYIGGLVGWPIMLFLFGSPMRNLGKYTLGDVLAYRLDTPKIRIISSLTSLIIILCYLVGQMVGAGAIIGLLFGLSYSSAVIIIGSIMLIYVLFGGMIATTWVQIVKTILMVTGAVALILLALSHFGMNPLYMFDAAADRYGAGALAPGRLITSPAEAISLSLALALGVASLPHILMRFFTVPNAAAANKSLLIATGIIGFFVFVTFLLGFSAMALVGREAIVSVDAGGNMAVPLLAAHVGGSALLGFIVAVSFATILAVVSGLMITGAATLSHDIWDNVVRGGRSTNREQLLVARGASIGLAVLAIALGLAMRGQNVAVLVGLTTAIAASANFPAIFLSVYWRRLTYAGAAWGMLGGLLISLVLIYLSPTVQIDILHHGAALVPLRNPAILSVPASFLLAMIVSLITRPVSESHYAEVETRMLVGSVG